MPFEIECPYCKNKLKVEREERLSVLPIEAPKVEAPPEVPGTTPPAE